MIGPTTSTTIIPIAAGWLREGRRVVSCTLVGSDGSAPLEEGSTMLIDDQGHIEGSVTGGCVESALVQESAEVFAGGEPRLRTYGVSDEDAVGVGLMCGGTVHVFIAALDPRVEPVLAVAAEAIERKEPLVIATLLDGEHAGAMVGIRGAEAIGSLESGQLLDHAVAREAEGWLTAGYSGIRAFGAGGEVMGSEQRVFIHAFAEQPRMIIFGAIDFSAAVAAYARGLGYRVTICDAREPFARGSRFEVADEVQVDWPDRYLASQSIGPRDVILVFTHDPKFDQPALVSALETEAGYIGALGSRRTHGDRRRRLLEAGVSESDLDRIFAPCGLDIGARTPEETAISVLAEIIAHSTARPGGPLSQTAGAIHEAKHPVA